MSREEDFDSWNHAIVVLKKELEFEEGKIKKKVWKEGEPELATKEWEQPIIDRVKIKIKQLKSAIEVVKKDLEQKKNHNEHGKPTTDI